MVSQPRDFVLLDGFRGLGALLIIIGHTMNFWIPFWPSSGAVIVDAFFMLSGFVIAYAYEPRVKAGLGVSGFMIYRLVRLFPLYLLGTLLGFGVAAVAVLNDPGGAEDVAAAFGKLATNLVMLPTAHMQEPYLYPFNPPAWTLFYELCINLLYIAAFGLLRDTRVLAGVVAAWAALLAYFVFANGGIDDGSQWQSFALALARGGFGFFAGVLIYRLVRRRDLRERPRSKWTLVLFVAIPLICMVPATPELRPFVDLALLLAMGMPLLWLSQRAEPPSQCVRLFTFGGRISYALYILHAPAVAVLTRLNWQNPSIADLMPLPGMALLVCMVAVAFVAEKYYDRPVRRWIVRRLKSRNARNEPNLMAGVAAE